MENFRTHPLYRDLKVYSSGAITKDGLPVKITFRSYVGGREISVIYVNRTALSAPKIILEAWTSTPPEGRVYARFKDGNKRNLSVENLFWSSNNLTKDQQLKRDCKLSALSPEDFELLSALRSENYCLDYWAAKFKVSPTTISRALKRINKLNLSRSPQL